MNSAAPISTIKKLIAYPNSTSRFGFGFAASASRAELLKNNAAPTSAVASSKTRNNHLELGIIIATNGDNNPAHSAIFAVKYGESIHGPREERANDRPNNSTIDPIES